MKYAIVESEYLGKKETNLMIKYSAAITKQMDDGDIYWSKDGTELEGNLKNYDNE